MILFADGGDGWVGEAIAAVVGGVLALLGTWLNRQRPKKVEVREMEVYSLLQVANTVRPRIKATMDDMPVAALSQIELLITNRGSDTIKDIELAIKFPDPTHVLECELSGVTANRKMDGSCLLNLTIPYLNSYRNHREGLTAKVVCDGTVRGITVSGRGEGWSAVHRTTDSILRFRVIVLGVVVFGGLGLLYLVNVALRNLYQLPPSNTPTEFSVIALLVTLLWSVIIFGTLFWANKAARRTGRIRRLLK